MWLVCPNCCGIYNSSHLKPMMNEELDEMYVCPYSECDHTLLKPINPLIENIILSLSDQQLSIADVNLSVNKEEKSYIIFFSVIKEALTDIIEYITFINKYKRLDVSEITGQDDRFVFSIVANNLDESLHERLEATSELIKFLTELNSHLIKENEENDENEVTDNE